MKRFITFLLALLYLAASTGFSIRQHWCMEAYAGASVHLGGESDEHECSRCGMKKSAGQSSGCCKDEQKIIKAADESIAAKVLSFDYTSQAMLPAVAPDFSNPGILYTAFRPTPLATHQWPPPRGVPLYVTNCVFLI